MHIQSSCLRWGANIVFESVFFPRVFLQSIFFPNIFVKSANWKLQSQMRCEYYHTAQMSQNWGKTIWDRLRPQVEFLLQCKTSSTFVPRFNFWAADNFQNTFNFPSTAPTHHSSSSPATIVIFIFLSHFCTIKISIFWFRKGTLFNPKTVKS